MNTTPTSTLTPGKSAIVFTQNKEKRIYRITEYLGRGGFGITYLAESDYYDNNIPQKGLYTIKEFCLSDICTRLADDSLAVPDASRKEFEESKQGFIHEAERLMKMKHEGIVPVNAVIEANGTAYYVMQYLGSTSLKKYVESADNHCLPEDEACSIACQIADALDYLHRQHVTHLDVKPVNVMMVRRPDGSIIPVLIDFGLACHYKKNGNQTNRHGATGTSDGYSPLEQYAGIECFSPEADVYALAATLFFMLTGHAPKKAGSLTESILMEELKGLELKDSTLTTLRQAMKKMPEQRLNSVKKFAQQLSSGIITEDGNDDDDGNKTKPRKTEKTKPFSWKIIASISAVILVIILTVSITNRCESTPEQSEEETTITNSDTIQGTSENAQQNTPNQNTNNNQHNNSNPNTTDNTEDNSNNQSSSTNSENSSQTVHQSTTNSGEATATKNLGYAIYKGKIKNGLPNGRGTLTFTETKKIESRDPDQNIAQPGEYVEGEFSNGHLIQGTWHKNDGTTTYLMIGGI